MVEIRDGESFAMAGLLRKDFQDTIRQVPLLGSLPIIGALFRSTGFQHQDSELVMIVTPHLVRPVPAGRAESADRSRRTSERGGSAAQRPDRHRRAAGRAGVRDARRRSHRRHRRHRRRPAEEWRRRSSPSGFEKDYGHVL